MCRPRDVAYSRAYLRERPLVYLASAAVQRAIRLKQLKPAAEFQCTDCPKEAVVYDHRNYLEPLNVEPVCLGCNRKRGAGHPYIGVGKVVVTAADWLGPPKRVGSGNLMQAEARIMDLTDKLVTPMDFMPESAAA